MPIYAYRCTTCGHAQDVLRKISDPPLTVCPACGAATFVKQVTAAGFQLKGSGWYVTDFRGDKKPTQAGRRRGRGQAPKARPARAAAAGRTARTPRKATPKSDTPLPRRRGRARRRAGARAGADDSQQGRHVTRRRRVRSQRA